MSVEVGQDQKIAEPLLRAAAEEGGEGKVVLIGIAQEKASAWRSWKRKGHERSTHPHMEWGRQMVLVNHFYFYLWDPDWGAAFWKTNAYAPFPIWLWLNGHSWAQRQLEKASIPFEALDNGFRWCTDPAALQRVCNRLGASAVHTFFWRWFHRLPSPFTADDLQAGYVYDLAFRQFEVSDTRVFDRPQTGRAFFEGASVITWMWDDRTRPCSSSTASSCRAYPVASLCTSGQSAQLFRRKVPTHFGTK